jgi:CPA2 family monovalent cation:H+ antiporter-2
MHEAAVLIDIVIILAASVVFVPLFNRARLGAVLGYLAAGACIGPHALGLVHDSEAIRTLAQLGVAFLLFTVGLGLPLGRFRVMAASNFLLGLLQIVVTAAAIGAVVWLAGLTLNAAILIGGALALSSTAIVLRLVSEGPGMTSRFGRAAVTVLVLQDLAVGPLLVVAAALGRGQESIGSALGIAMLGVAVAVLLIVGVGRYIVRAVFWSVAASRTPEVFAALTLLVVLLTGLATQEAGLSMAFGAFLAGLLLADTRYRHQVAAEIQPFQGLLLGLFFVTVGAGLDVRLMLADWQLVLGLSVALLAGKAAIVAMLGGLLGLSLAMSLQLGLLLAQAGEFAFVLLGAGMMNGLIDPALGEKLILVAVVTMIATPGLAWLGKTLAARVELARAPTIEAADASLSGLRDHVLIAGFGRVGRRAAARLAGRGVPYVAVDLDPHTVAQAAADGYPVYFGDATRPEVLEAVQVDRARAVLIAMNNPRPVQQLVTLLRYIFPDLPIYARAYDELHAEELRRAGASTVVPETVATASDLAGSILGDDQTTPPPGRSGWGDPAI